jgi:hypothetical protein
MSEDARLYDAPALLVTTDDGTVLRCEAHEDGWRPVSSESPVDGFST